MADDMEGKGIRVVMSLGSNCGDRRSSVAEAIAWLGKRVLECCEVSDIYETLPVGHSGANYMNAVAEGIFPGSCSALEKLCKDYELAKGRDEESRERNLVPIDIDIVIAEDKILRMRDYRCTFFQKGYRQIAASGGKSVL